MNNEDLYQLVDNPSSLNGDTLVYLERLVKEYPCFPVVCMLYLMNLAAVHDIRFGVELQRLSLYLPDRKKLFMLTEGKKYHLSFPEESVPNKDSFSLVDEFLSTHSEENAEKSASLLFEPTASTDYMHWSLDAQEDRAAQDAADHPLERQDLIDSFIEKGTQPLDLDTPATDIPSVQAASKSLDDSFFTETLAHIYIKQGRYGKALQIIQNLSLKFPEKNVYFADQIRFLKKLIINTQKI